MPKELTPAQRRISEARQRLAKEAANRLAGIPEFLAAPHEPRPVDRPRISAKDIPLDAAFHDASAEADRIIARRAEALEHQELQRQHYRDVEQAKKDKQLADEARMKDILERYAAGGAEALTPVEVLMVGARAEKKWAKARWIRGEI